MRNKIIGLVAVLAVLLGVVFVFEQKGNVTTLLINSYTENLGAVTPGTTVARQPSKIEQFGMGYDESKVENPENKNLDDIVGLVKNQIYVVSDTLDDQGLRAVLKQYPRFTVLGYDRDLMGLLVQFDDMDPAVPGDIESIRKIPGIHDVFNRVHRGGNAVLPL